MKAYAEPVEEMDDFEYRHASAAALMNSSVAAQIKIIREQRQLTQAGLAEMIGTKQAGISRLENVNYDAWKVATLTRIARAFDVRLRISFEEFDSLDDEINAFGVSSLQRLSYTESKARKRKRYESMEQELVPAALRKALAPSDSNAMSSSENTVEGINYAREIDTASKSLRLLGSGGTDTKNERISASTSRGTREEMRISQESLLSKGA